MKDTIIMDYLDLSDLDEKINGILREAVNEIIKKMESHRIPPDLAIAMTKVLILKTAIIISQGIERKMMDLIEGADSDMVREMLSKGEDQFSKT